MEKIKSALSPAPVKAGYRVLFEAFCDLAVGLTAYSDEGTNGAIGKPIRFRILRENA
jgi:hypothetical protein